jgi:hypothetical protein
MFSLICGFFVAGFFGLFSGVANAAPLTPAPVQDAPMSVELAAAVANDRMYLRVPGCAGACAAIRKEHWQGGEAALWLIPQLAVYGGAAHDGEETAAATYLGDGFRVHGGVKGGFDLRPGLGLNGWVSVAHVESKASAAKDSGTVGKFPDQARRNQLELGAVVRVGQRDGGLDGWVGLEALPYSVDLTRVVQGVAVVKLIPTIPVSAVGGVRLVSEPLGGPWAERGRLSAGLTGSVGYRVGFTGWLSVSL